MVRHTALLLLLTACADEAEESASRRAGRPGAPDTDIVPDTETAEDTGADDPDDTGDAPAPTPLPAPDTLTTARVTALADTIDAILAGTERGVRIVDAENGEIVYEYAPDAPLKPASNTKLYTTAAAMDGLGEDHRLRLAAYAPSAPDSDGEVASLTVLSEHDSTWSAYIYPETAFAAARLADRLYDAGVREVTGTLTLTGEVLVDGYSTGDYDAADHRSAGIDVLAEALEDRGIRVGATATSSSLATPSGRLLAERESPPLSVVCHPLNVYSHNEMADILARHVGWLLADGSSYDEGEQAMLELLDALGVDAEDVTFSDGSGLSHDNRVTATSTTELLLAMMERPVGQAWERTFATGGVSGTLAYRLSGDDTYGRVYGKTGTLSDTIALSGVLYHRWDGHRYVFSILQNDAWDSDGARALADAVVEALAEDLRGEERPDAPVLTTARNAGDGRLALAWEAVAGAQYYGVWTSEDGRVWDRGDAVVATGTSIALDGLPLDATVYVRVTAHADATISEPSDVYAATPSDAPSRILLVDGDDRWEGQSENPRGAGHDFVRTVAEAVEGHAVDSAANEAVADGSVSLEDYDVVIWLLGEESTEDATFDATERDRVATWLAAGGNLLVSGAELAWDLDAEGDDEQRAFLEEWLHARYVGDDAGTYDAEPVSGGLFDGIGEIGFYTPARQVVAYPDQLAPANGASAVLSYVDGDGGTAGVSYSGDYQVLTLGFPIEAVDGLDTRSALLSRVIDHFGL